MAPGYQLLPLVTLHFSNLDTTPTGLTALRGHEGTGLLVCLYILLKIRPTHTHANTAGPTKQDLIKSIDITRRHFENIYEGGGNYTISQP